MKNSLIFVALLSTVASAQVPLLSSWSTQFSARYARVVETNGGTPKSTWPSAGLPNMGGGQTTVAYSDIQLVSYSSNWVYVKATGLASHQMGPWYTATGAIFGNWPSNQKRIQRFPAVPIIATTKVTNGLGPLGLWVNGVALFNLLDGFSWNTTQGREVNGTNNIWVRNAVTTEGPTFDKSNAHQPGMGTYHYHSNPAALRYQLGDNNNLNTTTLNYFEDTSNLHHSPILGWANDGYPIYGPYGYTDPQNPTSPIRRIRSGFVIRDGQFGTTNLNTAQRRSVGQWAATLHNTTMTLPSTQYGPNITTGYPLGRYIEDFDFLGNLGYTQGTDFELDIYNGRNCRTPEFPNGTYAYFVTISADGTPAFPYVLGRQYYGTVVGGAVTSITESVTNYKNAGPNTPIEATVLVGETKVVVTWLSIEGGTYKIEGQNDSRNSTAWTTVATGVPSNGLRSSITFTKIRTAGNFKRYRVTLTGTATYDGF